MHDDKLAYTNGVAESIYVTPKMSPCILLSTDIIEKVIAFVATSHNFWHGDGYEKKQIHLSSKKNVNAIVNTLIASHES